MRWVVGLSAWTTIAIVAACTGGPDTTSSSTSSTGGSSSNGSSSGGSSSGGSSSGGSSSGSSSGGGTTCVTIDPSSYDDSCVGDGDCQVFPTGKLCTGGCGCGGTPLNKNEQAKWKADTAAIELEACPCASPGIERCVLGKCALCDPFDPAPGCPDGG